MWEFFSRKKEAATTPTEVVLSPETNGGKVRQPFEDGAEQLSEKAEERYAAILAQSSVSSQSVPVAADVQADVRQVGQALDATSQVNQLVELAQLKGVAHAVDVARKLNDLYVLDTMHDQLADTLYEALKAKGLIQSEGK